MYLRELKVDGLKLLRDFSLDFTRDGEPRMWTVLVGRNGLCKTSLLRAIALAASGRDLANELSTNQRQSFLDLRRDDGPMEVRAKLGFGEVGAGLGREFPYWPSPSEPPDYLEASLSLSPGARSLTGNSSYSGHPLHSKTAKNNAAIFAGADPLADARQRSLPHWFVAGYGVQRLLPGAATTKSPDDFVRVRLETLFDAGTLISTDFADHLAKRFGDEEAHSFADLLHRALLGDEKLLPKLTAFELRGQGGVSSADRLINSHRFDMKELIGDEYRIAKSALYEMQYYKCCYCESKQTSQKWRTIEHYRPKTIAARNGQQYPGYWWLAWTWENLLLSCNECNASKGTRFPLSERSTPLNPEDSPPGTEEPLLLDPSDDAEDPRDHILFRPVGDSWWPFPRNGSPRGREMLEALKLYHPEFSRTRVGLLDMWKNHARALDKYVISDVRKVLRNESAEEIRAIWEDKVTPYLFTNQQFVALSIDIFDYEFVYVDRIDLDRWGLKLEPIRLRPIG